MHEDPDNPVREWLAAELKKQGHGSKKRFAEFLGVSQTVLGRMLPGSREPRRIEAGHLLRMQQYFGSSPDRNVEVPVMGYVGAGAEVLPEFEQVPPDGLDLVSIPLAMPAEMIAFQVRGDSMYPVYRDGHVIVVYREQRKPIESFYGTEAAVRTTDGRRFIKTITRGQRGVNLISWNAAPIEGVNLAWVGEIFAALPASALRWKEAWAGGPAKDDVEVAFSQVGDRILREELQFLARDMPEKLPRLLETANRVAERVRNSGAARSAGTEYAEPEASEHRGTSRKPRK